MRLFSHGLPRCEALRAARAFSSSAADAHRVVSGVRALGVVGAGQMGSGIALVAATAAKIPVVVVDKDEQQLLKAQDYAKRILAKDVSKGAYLRVCVRVCARVCACVRVCVQKEGLIETKGRVSLLC